MNVLCESASHKKHSGHSVVFLKYPLYERDKTVDRTSPTWKPGQSSSCYKFFICEVFILAKLSLSLEQ